MSKETKAELVPVKRGSLGTIGAPNAEELKKFPKGLNEIYKNVMQKGVDYGTTPGTPKPSLWKPGAEALQRFFHLSSESVMSSKKENTDYKNPFFAYTFETRVYDKDGLYVGNGFGAANSKETRYAYRWVGEKLVPYEQDQAKLPTRVDNGVTLYRIDTPPSEVFTLQNTLIKMAEKRSYIDATIKVTGASRIFTQDVADDESEKKKIEQAKAVGRSPAKAPTSTTGSTSGSTPAQPAQPSQNLGDFTV